MARRLLSPLKAARPDNWQDIQRVLADIHALINPVTLEIDGDFEVPNFDGVLYLVCTNSSSITITHTDKPKDLSRLFVVRTDAQVVVSGNGININGSSSITLSSAYESADIQYFEVTNEHIRT